MHEDDQFMPESPEFSEAEYRQAEENRNAMPILFEWHKWTSLVANRVASIDPSSPGFRSLPGVQAAVLRGLMNRASRLMLASLRLASLQKHGEAILLLNRSICETAVLVQWLCKSESGDAFKRYLAKGLKAELCLKDDINAKIRQRGGATQPIEKRMLAAIAELCSLAELTEDEVRASKSLPDYASLLRALDHDELSYTVMQRLGSHAVHGTWPDLLFHYIEPENGSFVLTDNVIPPQGTEFVASATIVLEAVAAFAQFVLLDEELVSNIVRMTEDAIAEIVRVYRLTAGDDHAVS